MILKGLHLVMLLPILLTVAMLLLYSKKPEKCYLKSRTKFRDLKNDPNNIVYMSRQLHEYFDGISQVDGVPAFTLNYVQHEPQVTTRVCDGNNTLHVYETKDPEAFREYAAFKADETRQKWASLAGPDRVFDD